MTRQITLSLGLALLVGAGVWFGVSRLPVRPESRSIAVIAISGNGKTIVSGTSPGHIVVWDAGSANVVQEMEERDGALKDLLLDENALVVANRNLVLRGLGGGKTRRVLRGDGANYGTIRRHPTEAALLTVTGRGEIAVVNLADGRITPKACCSTIYGEVAFAPDGRTFLAAGHWPGIWEYATGRLIARFTREREFIPFGPIAVDGDRVFMGSQDGRVLVWDLETRGFVRASAPVNGYVRTIVVLGKTGWVAYAASGGAVQLWNAGSGERREIASAVTTSNLVYDSVRNRLAFGTAAGALQFWSPPPYGSH